MKLTRHAFGLRAFLFCSAAAGLVLVAQTQGALAQKISSEIRGTVMGADGSLVDGASVKIRNTATGATLTTTTSGGAFEVTGLAIGGPYTITVDAPGLSEKSVSGIYLSSDPSDVNIPLGSIANVETVVVSGQRTAAATAIVEQHGVTTTFTQEVVQQTPTFQNNLKDLMQKSPFAFVDPVGGGNLPPIATLNVAGANPRCVPLLVDGLEQSDNFGLNFSGYPTPTSPVAYPWIDQAQLIVTPYDVEYNSCGPVQNIVTKQGSNDFHGGFYGSFDDQSLNGDKYSGTTQFGVSEKFLTTSQFNALTPAQLADQTKNYQKYGVKPPYRNENYGAYLSGPLVEDHLFFFVGYDENRNTTNPGAQTAVGPAGSGFAKTAPNITQSEIDQITSISENKYGFNPGNLNDLFTEYDTKFIGKLTWQINDSQRIVASYQHTTGETLTVNSGSTSTFGQEVTLPSDWYVNAQKLESMTLQWFANWTDDFQTQINVGHTSVRDNQTPLDGNNFPEMIIQVPGPCGAPPTGTITASATKCPAAAGTSDAATVVLGPDFSRQYNFLFYKDDFGKGLATWVLGDHTLKGGVEFHRYSYDDKFLQGATSVIRFNSISDFQNGIIANNIDSAFNATATSLQQGNPVYFASGAITGSPSDADGKFRYLVGSAFIQDNWDPIQGLDITGGLRMDQYWDGDKPILNAFFTKRYGFTNQKTFNGQYSLDPRLSANYDWLLDDDFVPSFVPDDSDINFRGGVGKLSGGILAVWMTDAYDTTGITAVNTFGIPGNGGPGPCTSAHPYACVPTTYPGNLTTWLNDLRNGPLAQASVANSGTVNALLPGFKLPSTLYFNLGADISFGDGYLGEGWKLSGDFLGSDDYNQPYWTNLRIMPSGKTAPDGRIIYQWTFDQVAGRPDPNGNAGQLTGTDIGLGSKDGGHRQIFALTLSNSWKDTGYGDFTVYASYTHEHLTDTGGAVASVANSVYTDRASVNFNEPEVGTSDYQRTHRFTLDVDATEHFVDDLATIFDVYAQRLSGQPFSLTFGGDPFGPFPVGGTTANGGVSGKSLVYVPAVDPTTHAVTATSDPRVTYAGGFDLAGFNTMLNQTGLIKYAGRIAPRNAFEGPWNTLINVKVDQQLPLPDLIEGQRLFAEVYIFNLGNLINHNWGPQFSPNFYQAYSAYNASIVGNQYQFTGFNSAKTIASNINVNRNPSTYQISFAIKYDF